MTWKYKGGLLLIICVVIVWVTCAEVTQGVFIGYNHPFAVSYLGTSLLVVYLPIAFIKEWLLKSLRCRASKSRKISGTIDDKSSAGIDDPAKHDTTNDNLETEHNEPLPNKDCAIDLCPKEEEVNNPLASQNNNSAVNRPEKAENKLSMSETAILGFCIAPLWFLTEYLTNAALARTSVTSTILLSSTSCLFTLLNGAILGEDRINLVKVISVVVSMTGVAMTAVGKTWAPDEQTRIDINQKHSLLGDLFAVLSAFTYGLFTVLLKKFTGEGGERADMEKLFGCIGLFILGALWWLVWPLTAMRIEPKFKFPRTAKVEGIILANGFVGNVVGDYFWALGVVWTNPLVAALGISLMIPLAMLEDMIIHGRHYSTSYIIGSIQVFLGFVIVNLAEWISQKLRWRW